MLELENHKHIPLHHHRLTGSVEVFSNQVYLEGSYSFSQSPGSYSQPAGFPQTSAQRLPQAQEPNSPSLSSPARDPKAFPDSPQAIASSQQPAVPPAASRQQAVPAASNQQPAASSPHSQHSSPFQSTPHWFVLCEPWHACHPCMYIYIYIFFCSQTQSRHKAW